MDAKLKKKWIRALRSGKYRQAEASLYDKGAHCCLGVLARVQGATARGGCLKIGSKDVRKPKNSSHEEYLAREFAAGLHTKTQQRLGGMNDGAGAYLGERKSFKQIADFIEKNL